MKVLILCLALLFYFVSTKIVLKLLYKFYVKILENIITLSANKEMPRKSVYLFMLYSILYFSLPGVPLLYIYLFLSLLDSFYQLNCTESLIVLGITVIYMAILYTKMFNSIYREYIKLLRKKKNKNILSLSYNDKYTGI